VSSSSDAPITALRCAAYGIPTDAPEADGTLSWDKTTLVLVEVEAAGHKGLGYTYSDACLVELIAGKLAEIVVGADALDIRAVWAAMRGGVRNLGRSGLAGNAISAVDCALWDLKAKLLDRPLVSVLGRRRDQVDVYGSGGFTSYNDAQLREQLSGWVERDGCSSVKMKIGSDPAADPHRIEVAKAAIGAAALFVDANGAFDPKRALHFIESVQWARIEWFEEPVTSDDLAGLRFVRERAPANVAIAAGEYNYTLDDARRLLEAQAVDVLQADVTRCCGITGFLQIAALCEAFHIDLSGHCAPSLHRHPACAAPRFRNLEYFHDHVRIEHMLFDGAAKAEGGAIRPDLGRPGLGLAFKSKDAERFLVRAGGHR
jgi:L-alanine-DL-glutamate epimerase-like enolase superfamily enzyme